MAWKTVRAVAGGALELGSIMAFLGAVLLWADALSGV
jgi:hypothetical protein